MTNISFSNYFNTLDLIYSVEREEKRIQEKEEIYGIVNEFNIPDVDMDVLYHKRRRA